MANESRVIPKREPRVRDFNDTFTDLAIVIREELRKHPDSKDATLRIEDSLDELKGEFKKQSEAIISLRLKGEHLIERAEVNKIASEAQAVTRERIDNLVKWVAASQSVIGGALMFLAAKVFKSG